MTYTDKDHDYYKENMTKYRKMQNGQNSKIYDVTYKNTRDIVVASHKKQVDEFVKLYSDKKRRVSSEVARENASRYLESVYGTKFSKKDVEKTDVHKGLKNEFENYNMKQLRDEGYNQFIKTYSDIPVAKIYQKKFIRQGYNAIWDDNDILNNTMDSIRPEKSIITFSGRKNLKNVGSKELTEKEYKQALGNNSKRRKRIG